MSKYTPSLCYCHGYLESKLSGVCFTSGYDKHTCYSSMGTSTSLFVCECVESSQDLISFFCYAHVRTSFTVSISCINDDILKTLCKTFTVPLWHYALRYAWHKDSNDIFHIICCTNKKWLCSVGNFTVVYCGNLPHFHWGKSITKTAIVYTLYTALYTG